MTLFLLTDLDPLLERERGAAFVGDVEFGNSGQTLLLDQFLSSFVARTHVPSGCHGSAAFSLRGGATFDGTVLIHLVDETSWRKIGPHGTAQVFPGVTVAARVEFARPVCGPAVATFFLHSGYLYDFRFDVESVSWNSWGSAEGPGEAPHNGLGPEGW